MQTTKSIQEFNPASPRADSKRQALGAIKTGLDLASGASDFIPFGNIVKVVADTGSKIIDALNVSAPGTICHISSTDNSKGRR